MIVPNTNANIKFSIRGNGTLGCDVSGECIAKLVKGDGVCFYKGGMLEVEIFGDEVGPIGVRVKVTPYDQCSRLSFGVSGYPAKRGSYEFVGVSVTNYGSNSVTVQMQVMLS